MALLFLSREHITRCITMDQAIHAMESAFIELAHKTVQLPLRTSVPVESEQGLTLTMPAYLGRENILGLKVVSVFPHNLFRNIPSINGLIMLLNPHTGEPQALMEAGYLTALRTGAVSGLATNCFATDDAHRLAIIGSGAQAKSQLEAVASVRDIKIVNVWSRDEKHATQFAKTFQHRYDINVCHSVALAVKEADIICTATPSTEPLIVLNEIQSHAHINAIGSHTPNMREISNEVLNKGVVIVDQLSAALSESGEIINAVSEKQLKKTNILEIGHWLTHERVDYKNRITVFKSVGLAIQDLSVAAIVYRNAIKQNIGISLSF